MRKIITATSPLFENSKISCLFSQPYFIIPNMKRTLTFTLRLKKLLFQGNYTLADDTMIGIYCVLAGIDLIPSPRLDIPSLEAWTEMKDHIPKDTFHIRAKNLDEPARQR